MREAGEDGRRVPPSRPALFKHSPLQAFSLQAHTLASFFLYRSPSLRQPTAPVTCGSGGGALTQALERPQSRSAGRRGAAMYTVRACSVALAASASRFFLVAGVTQPFWKMKAFMTTGSVTCEAVRE